jgi:hypothetical protein
MKNIHIIPTDKPSTLFKDDFGEFLISLNIDQEQNHFKAQQIYITSCQEEIKEGDWFMSDFNSFPLHNIKKFSEREGSLGWKQEDLKNNLKIILTTDPELIENGVHPICDDFIELYVNKSNQSSKNIDIVHVDKIGLVSENGRILYGYKYNITIPKEYFEIGILNTKKQLNIEENKGHKTDFKLIKVKRFMVIEDRKGTVYSIKNLKEVELSYQDDGKTLKIFLK